MWSVLHILQLLNSSLPEQEGQAFSVIIKNAFYNYIVLKKTPTVGVFLLKP